MKCRYAILFIVSIVYLYSYNDLAAQDIQPDFSKFKTIHPKTPSISLIDYIRRLPGIMVFNQGGKTKIIARNISTFQGENSPLFIIDGRRVGTDLDRVKLSVDVVDIASIRFMNAQDATIRYGIRAGSGAIIIQTKR